MTVPVVHQPDPQQPTALYRQLYLNLRAAILAGRLKRGARLPSTRELAVSLNVSRNTVLNAFEQLLAEGYLETLPASGTFVSLHLPVDQPRQRPLADSRLTHWSRMARSFRGAPALHVGDQGPERPGAFRAGLPAPSACGIRLGP